MGNRSGGAERGRDVMAVLAWTRGIGAGVRTVYRIGHCYLVSSNGRKQKLLHKTNPICRIIS